MIESGFLKCAKNCPYQRGDPAPPCGTGMALGAEARMFQCDATREVLEKEIEEEPGITAARHIAGELSAVFYSTNITPPNYSDWRTWDMVFVVVDGKKVAPEEYFQVFKGE